MSDPRLGMNNPCFTTEEWLDAMESGQIADIDDSYDCEVDE